MEKDKMETICFVSSEIWPGTGGGIGRLISENARLLATGGIAPVFLLDVDEQARDCFAAYASESIPRARIYTVNDLLTTCDAELRKFGEPAIGQEDFRFYHYWRAYLIDLCLQYILTGQKIDGIEFADYLGQGYVYFRMRPLRPGCRQVPAWLRLHGSAELWDEADGRDKFVPERLQLYDMERYCLARCDCWVAPSAGVRDWYTRFYGLKKNCRVSPPGFQRLGPGCVHPRRPDPFRPRRVLFYGKLQRIKGPDILLEAALEYLQRDDPSAEFLLVGPDVPAAGGESMRSQLEQMIPKQFLPNFIFQGKIDPAALPELAARCDLAVIPSRVETFCLAAHELNWLGIPLIVSDIPGLRDFFVDEVNCLKFNGTAENLYVRMKWFFDRQQEVTESLKWQVPEPDISPLDLYKALSSGSGLGPHLLAKKAKEPPVALLIEGVAQDRQALTWLPELEYQNWQAWQVGEQASIAGVSERPDDPLLLPGEDIFEKLPDGRRRLRWDRLDAEFFLFLPALARPRPEFLRRAVETLRAEPGLAGVTCFAVFDRQLPPGKKFVIPYDLNPFLIFVESITGAVPALWRREAVAKLCLEDFLDPGGRWSFLCSLAAAGKKVAVLPVVLMDLGNTGYSFRHLPRLRKHSGYLRKNAPELVNLLLYTLDETKELTHQLGLRVWELEKSREEYWNELKRLSDSWEVQKDYIHTKEKECEKLWNEVVELRRLTERLYREREESHREAEQLRQLLEKQRAKMDSLLSYLENKKLVKAMMAAGILNITRFKEG